MRVHVNGTRALVVAVALAAALAGCSDKLIPPVLHPPPPSPYPKLVNPFSVVEALRIAYENRDSTEIKLLYDDNYQGSSADGTDPYPVILRFYKFDEVRHVAKLAHAGLSSVTLTTAYGLVREQDLSDPPGWAMIRNPYLSLEISDSTSLGTHTVDFTSERTVFKFAPHTPDPSSVTDTTWKIIGWTEIPN